MQATFLLGVILLLSYGRVVLTNDYKLSCPKMFQPCTRNNDCKFGCCSRFNFNSLKGGCCIPEEKMASSMKNRGECLRDKSEPEPIPGVCPPPPSIWGYPYQCYQQFGPPFSECRDDVDCQRYYGFTRSKCCRTFRGQGCYAGKKCL